MNANLNLRIAIVYTQENVYAQLILANMLSQAIKPVGLVTLKETLHRRDYFSLLLQPKRILAGLLCRLRNILCSTVSPESEITLSQQAEDHLIPIYRVNNINSDESASLLREIVKPDLLILGGAPIIRQQILDIPTIGTLNAHPGYLPLFKGMDVIRWAIIEQGPLAVTLHFADRGVDTGPILLREPIPLYLSDDIAILRKRAAHIAAKLIVKGIKMISRSSYNTIAQSGAEGKWYYRMSEEQAEEAEAKLQERITEEINPRFDLE